MSILTGSRESILAGFAGGDHRYTGIGSSPAAASARPAPASGVRCSTARTQTQQLGDERIEAQRRRVRVGRPPIDLGLRTPLSPGADRDAAATAGTGLGATPRRRHARAAADAPPVGAVDGDPGNAYPGNGDARDRAANYHDDDWDGDVGR